VGPSEDRPSPSRKQARRRPARPRRRRCLLKGCEEWFQPACPQARYCRAECQRAAARWRQWKARRRYRSTEGGRECRRAQSRRRRQAELERRGERRATNCDASRPGGSAWVIAQQEIFVLVRPAWLLRDLRADTPVTDAAILLAGLPTCAGTGVGTREAVAATVAGASERVCAAAPDVS